MRELQELDSSTKHYSNSETLESSIDADSPLRPKYGNLIVLFRTNSILLTIGPDCNSALIQISASSSQSLSSRSSTTSRSRRCMLIRRIHG